MLVVSSMATASSAPTVTAPAFALTGTAVGGVKTIQNGQTLTFAFTETNKGTRSAPEDLVVTQHRNVRVVAVTCVLPGGFAINPDGSSCEPGFLNPGRSASSVITTRVIGDSGQRASVTLCLTNENTGTKGPCKTISVPIA